ncbi:MAG: LysM peptidoglycan-binding domain-containing protein [Microthrixaceae bacterium]
MAAIIDFRTGTALTDPGDLQVPPASARRPQLRLVHGGRSAVGRQRRRVFVLRRALVVAALVVAAAVCVQLGGVVVQAFSTPVSGAAGPVGASATRGYVVQPGDTLWAVAAQVAPGADPADVVDRLVELNSTAGVELRSDAPLRTGQRLVVPASVG